MIIATVITCPQRWTEYVRLRGNFERLRLGFPLRTFQTSESLGDPRRNGNLNAMAAIRYCVKHLPGSSGDGMLFLEDDVELMPELGEFIAETALGGLGVEADCWYLCNRKVPCDGQFQRGVWVLNELKPPIQGCHALLWPARSLPKLLEAVWDDYADRVMFKVLERTGARVLQVVSPVLAVHRGEVSTFAPHRRTKLEVNHANPCHNDQTRR